MMITTSKGELVVVTLCALSSRVIVLLVSHTTQTVGVETTDVGTVSCGWIRRQVMSRDESWDQIFKITLCNVDYAICHVKIQILSALSEFGDAPTHNKTESINGGTMNIIIIPSVASQTPPSDTLSSFFLSAANQER